MGLKSTRLCPKCQCSMIAMRSEDKKVCSNGACGYEMAWPLEEGQQYMFKRNVEPIREPRQCRL